MILLVKPRTAVQRLKTYLCFHSSPFWNWDVDSRKLPGAPLREFSFTVFLTSCFCIMRHPQLSILRQQNFNTNVFVSQNPNAAELRFSPKVAVKLVAGAKVSRARPALGCLLTNPFTLLLTGDLTWSWVKT